MRGLRELIDPASLATGMAENTRFVRGVMIFLSAIVAHTASSLYYVEEKLNVGYASSGVKLPAPPITEAPEAVFSAVLYLCLGFLTVTGVFSIVVYLRGRERRSLLPVFSSAMHGFLAFTLATLILLPALLSAPPLNAVITYAEVEEVKLENARIDGVLRSNESALTITSQVLRSPKIIYNASNQDYPILVMSAVGRFSEEIVSLGDILVERLDWDRMEFSGYNFLTEPALSREPLSAIATLLSWLWTVSYIGLACRKLYKIGLGETFTSIALSMTALLIFGLL
ncbi:MAG: hypothetical protein RMJ28_06075 [Nitrososphaerota archaeon]|nr:hypothetical protein [Candidatus Calditenuaceae archaeon]MDW8073781.1 hypothetical protein [Nitrososphaerota archaeon]